MPVVAMVGKYGIIQVRQGSDNRHLAQFLPQAGMRGTRYQATAKLGQDKLFGTPNEITVGIQMLRFRPNQRPPGGIGIESRYLVQSHTPEFQS